MTLQNNKTTLRQALRSTLSLLKTERKSDASCDACLFLIKHLQGSSCKVLSFASKPFEINLWPLNRWLVQEKRLLLPKIENDQISVYEVHDLNALKLSSTGIQEPCHIRSTKIETFEESPFILVPALGYDENHHRLGYGKGHYDRFLLNLPQSVKWGIGFREQKHQSLPVEDHDVALDKVLFF